MKIFVIFFFYVCNKIKISNQLITLIYFTKLTWYSKNFFSVYSCICRTFEIIMTSLLTSIKYSPSHMVNNAGVIKYNENPLKGFVEKGQEGRVKRLALAGSAATTLVYLFALAKGAKKGNFKISDMFKIDFKNMFKVMGLATSAVIGGTTAGILSDKKENRKPKLKEAIHQFLGNIITPITIVGVACNMIEKKNFSKTKELVLSGISAIVGVAAGVTGGNWIASKVNKAIFKDNDERKLSIKDFGIHVDDLLTVAALSSIGDYIRGFISKALPAIFLICGYEAGTKTAVDKHSLHSRKVVENNKN